MNFSQGNNNSQKNDVNTRGPQFSNVESEFPSALVIGFWNGLVSLKFHPPLDPAKRTENNFFDYDKNIQTALTLDKVAVLAEDIENVIIPALENKETKSVGFLIGIDSLISLGTKETDKGMIAYLGLFKGINPETRKPDTFMMYEFRRTGQVNNYDPLTGDFEREQGPIGELLLFKEILKAARGALSNVYTHANRVVDRFYRDTIKSQLDAVAEKMGLPTQGNRSGGGGYNRNRSQGDVFGSGSAGGGGNTGRSGGYRDPGTNGEAQVQEIKNMDDISQFMED